MKIVGDFDFYRNWCLGVREMLVLFEDTYDEILPGTTQPKNGCEYFLIMQECMDNFFENVLHDIVDVEQAGVNIFINKEEVDLILDNYGDDNILTNQKIGEYALYELAITVIEYKADKFHRGIDMAV